MLPPPSLSLSLFLEMDPSLERSAFRCGCFTFLGLASLASAAAAAAARYSSSSDSDWLSMELGAKRPPAISSPVGQSLPSTNVTDARQLQHYKAMPLSSRDCCLWHIALVSLHAVAKPLSLARCLTPIWEIYIQSTCLQSENQPRQTKGHDLGSLPVHFLFMSSLPSPAVHVLLP